MNRKIPGSNNGLEQRKRVEMIIITQLTGRNILLVIQNEAIKKKKSASIQQITPEIPNN